MESAGSLYSGSPESKSTLDTPENGPYDNYFNLNTPSDLHLSPTDDSYAEWKALPSRLLESPPPGISAIQFRAHPASFEEMALDSKMRSCGFEVGEGLGNHHPSAIEVLAECSTPGTIPRSHSINVRHYLENLTVDDKLVEPIQGLNGSLPISSNSRLDLGTLPAEWPAASCHLKICNISSVVSLVILYEIFQVSSTFKA